MSAVFSPCGEHRLFLERQIDLLRGPTACLVGVNPSRAGPVENDQTIRKDMGFAKLHGWSRIWKVNFFTLIATDVRDLERRAAEAVYREDADQHLARAIRDCDILVGCWGSLLKLPPVLRLRWQVIRVLAENHRKPIWCFGTTRDGHPRHTARIPYESELIRWTPPE